MKTSFLALFLFLTLNLFGQCDGIRYKDAIFENEKKTVLFGNNTKFNGLNQDLYLDLYLPSVDTFSKRPVVILCFGGGFVQGSRTSGELVYFANYYSKLGYVVASIDYRLDQVLNITDPILSSKAVIRAVHDGRAAIRFLKSKHSEYKLDTNLFFIGGTSAGGVLSLTLAYSQYDDFSPILKKVIDSLGGFEGTSNSIKDYTSKIKGVFHFAGGISDTAHIKSNEVPAYHNHSVLDPLVPFRKGLPLGGTSPNPLYGSYLMHKRLNNLGIYSVIDSFENANHPAFVVGNTFDFTILTTTVNSLRNFLYRFVCPSTINIKDINSTISVYPNPFLNYLRLDGIKNGDLIQIFDMKSNCVLSKINKDQVIDMSRFGNGVYVLYVNHNMIQKIVK
jgi:acetyl esterase/lipase